MTRRYARALTIAGSDSGGGAGIQADLKTFSALGCYGMSVVTALTAQNTRGVLDVHPVPAPFVTAQLEAVLDDLGADAVKIGMLHSPEVIEAVASALARRPGIPVVLDPVMVAKSGDRLLREDAVRTLLALLVPRATVLTPNLPEAETLLGRRIAGRDAMEPAARDLLALGPRAVALKGGHLERAADSPDVVAIRRPENAVETRWLAADRVDTANTHGTGCTFSSAIAAGLARGAAVPDAIEQAKRYLTRTLAAGAAYRIGSGHGPVHHFAEMWPEPSFPASLGKPASDGRPAGPHTGSMWRRIEGVFAATLAHPFLAQLAEGELSKDRFGFYLQQDALYLQDFSRALALAGVRSAGVAELTAFLEFAHGAVVVERALHDTYFEEYGVRPAAEKAPACFAYTHFLVSTAACGDYAEAVAALLPCFWIYREVGLQVLAHAREGLEANPYRRWIETYAGEEFGRAVDRALAITEEVALAADEPTRERMKRAFDLSARLEWMFWDSAWRLERWPPEGAD